MSEHSAKFELVKKYFDICLWNEDMVNNAINRWITEDEAAEILEANIEVIE